MKRLARSVFPKRLWTQLRLLRLRHSINTYKSRRVRHNYGGFDLEIELTDPLSEGWYDHEWSEPTEIGLLKQGRLRQGARVFDLGAHQCVVAAILGKIVGQNGSVVALEANAHNAKAGQRNVDLNALQNVTVINAAASDRSGKLVFNQGLNGNVVEKLDEWGRSEVAAYSVDDLSDRYGVPDVLFVDVEGYECRVLAGAPFTLSTCPDCFVEVHIGAGLENFGGSVKTILSFFPPDRYKLYGAPPNGEEFSPLTEHSSFVAGRFLLVALAANRRPSLQGPFSVV